MTEGKEKGRGKVFLISFWHLSFDKTRVSVYFLHVS